MNKTTEALKLAEEALKSCKAGNWSMTYDELAVDEALAAIREALAEQDKPNHDGLVYYKNNACKAKDAYSPDCICWTKADQDKQEPVAWMVTSEGLDGTPNTYPLTGRYKDVCDMCDFGDPVPLYAAPVSASEQEPVIWHSVWDFVDVRRDPPLQGDEANWIPLYAAPVSVEAEWIETNKALAKELIEQRNQYLDKLAEAIELSVKAEREACAKVCEEHGPKEGSMKLISDGFAAAIRARGEK